MSAPDGDDSTAARSEQNSRHRSKQVPASPSAPAVTASVGPSISETATQLPAVQSDSPTAFESRMHAVPGYELGGEIGRGGMGVVYRARDLALQRDVAVKILQEKYAPNSTTAERFLEEARITGQLQHPGIPAIYQVGKMFDGRPFLAMKLIKGNTLDGLLAKRDDSGANTERAATADAALPNGLAIFESICQAVGYAHAHDVIHRDLKPANVMVGAFGEVQVMDWGLAKVLTKTAAREEKPEPAEFIAATEIRSARDSETQAGSIMGTPAFMSPEQAAAEGSKIDQRADVFGLGAILCVMVSGQPPFGGVNVDSVRINAMRGKTEEAFGRLDASGADPEVVSLCKRCLAFEPHDRPADASMVAREIAALRQAAENRAKQAELNRARFEVQATEQRKRSRVVSVAAGAIIATLVFGVAASCWQAIRARRAEDSALEAAHRADTARLAESEQRQLADVQRDAAQKARDRTREALDAMTSSVTGNSLTTQKEISAEQKKFLTQVLTYYKEFTGEQAEDEQSRSRTAAAAFRVGLIEYRLGRKAESAAAFQMARDEYLALAAKFPAIPKYRQELARSRQCLGIQLADLGKGAEAEEQYLQALTIHEKLAAELPAVPEYRQDVATSHNNLGALLTDLGKRSEAEEQYRQALAIFEKLAAELPAAPEYRQDVAMSYNNLGNLLAGLGKRTEAKEQYRQALAIEEKLAAEFPGVPNYRQKLAGSHNNLGTLLAELGQRAGAEEQYRQALAIHEKLAAEFSAVPGFRSDLAMSHNNLGLLLGGLGKRVEAEEQYRQALAILEKLAAEFPGVPKYRQDSAKSHNNLAVLLADLGKHGDAEGQCRQAQAIQEKLAKEFPSVPAYRQELARIQNYLGVLLTAMRKRPEAEMQFRQALGIQEKLATEFPAVPEYQVDLGGSYCNYGRLQRDGGHSTESLVAFDKAIRSLTAAYDLDRRSVTAKRFLRNSYENRATAYDNLQNHTEAAKDWDKAIELSPKSQQPVLRAARANSRVHAGQVVGAVAEVAELTKADGWNAGQWYDFACVYAIASGKVTDKKQEYADRAIELLSKAVNAGYRDAAHMAKDFDSLRDRADFKKLLADIGKKNSPKSEK